MWNKYSISISEWWVFFPNKCHWNMCWYAPYIMKAAKTI
jgi:hypothetical protein